MRLIDRSARDDMSAPEW